MTGCRSSARTKRVYKLTACLTPQNTHLYGLCDPDGVWRDDKGRQIDEIELPPETVLKPSQDSVSPPTTTEIRPPKSS